VISRASLRSSSPDSEGPLSGIAAKAMFDPQPTLGMVVPSPLPVTPIEFYASVEPARCASKLAR
jgi:hypothetical protein